MKDFTARGLDPEGHTSIKSDSVCVGHEVPGVVAALFSIKGGRLEVYP